MTDASPPGYVDLAGAPDALRDMLVRLGLAAQDEDVLAQPLTGGVSSGIYRVDLRSGRYCVKQALPKLKVAKDWRVPVERVFHEIAWLRTAGAIVPGHVPQVLGSDDATKSFVMPYLGEAHRNWKAELLAGHVDVEAARSLGDVLGCIHAATADDESVARRFATDANFHAIRLEPYLVETARVHPALAPQLQALVDRTAATRRTLVHGDVSPKNVLLGPAGPVLLDAECAWFGDPAFDAAFCLNHFLLKAAHLPAHGDALLAAFDAFAGAYLARALWEPAAALEARIATLLPGLTLARIDGKSPAEYLGDGVRAAVRRTAIALLHAPSPHLSSITRHWRQAFAPP